MKKLISIVKSFSRLKPYRNGVVVDDRVGALRTFATSNGYWRDSITKSFQQQIVDALRVGERNKASTLLSELGRVSEELKASDFVFILQQCARLPDPLFALETWKLMMEKEIRMGGKCYFYTVRALCKGGNLKEAFHLMNLLRENPDLYPLLPVYNCVLSACAQTSSGSYANRCLELMEHQMVGKNEITYAECLKLAVLQQNLSLVHEIWRECVKYYSLSIVSLRKFIWSFTRLRDLESAYVTLQYMVALAFRRRFVITKTAEGKLFDSRLDIPIPANGDLTLKISSKDNIFVSSISEYHNRIDDHANKSESNIKNGMENSGLHSFGISKPEKVVHMPVRKVLRWSFSDVIHACAKVGNYTLAEQLLLQMQNLGLEPSCGTYDGFLRAVLGARGFHDGMEVIKVMRQKNLKPYDSTLAAISVSCSKALELDLAEAFLDQISKCPSPYPYNAFLQACYTLDRPERAIQMLAKMKNMNLLPDIRTYELLFSLFGNVNAPYEEGNMLSQVDAAKRINAIQKDMMKNGIQHSHISLKNLLKALGMEGMVKELIQYLRVVENPSSSAYTLLGTPIYNITFSSAYTFLGTPIYNIVLHSLVEAKETDMAVETFKAIKLSGIPPDAATYNIMIDCCSFIKCFKSACGLVSMMIRDGFYPQTATYTTLIKTLLGLEDFDGALKLLNQGKLDGIQPDLLLYNTILQSSSEKGRIDVIELIVDQMHQEKIQPDPSTCSYVFSAYVDQGFYSTAMEAIQVLSMRMISLEDDPLEEKRMEFENLIVAEDIKTESQIMELFKESEDLALALLYLRWCSTVGFPVSWFPNESQWAKRLSYKYVPRGVPGQ